MLLTSLRKDILPRRPGLGKDYHGIWAPFAPLPFGLGIDAYAVLQSAFSLPFGLFVMGSLALALVASLRLLGKRVRLAAIFSILGATFFLPFVLVQPVDQLILALVGWQLVPVTVVHTAILFWESWTGMEVISATASLRPAQRLGGMAVLAATWIAITGVLWR